FKIYWGIYLGYLVPSTVGVDGHLGVSVPLPVEWDIKPEQDTVTHITIITLVLREELHTKFARHHVEVVGVRGVVVRVVNHAEGAYRRNTEPAPIQFLYLEDKDVEENRCILSRVTLILVQLMVLGPVGRTLLAVLFHAEGE
ncbi:uncharacterized protein LOC134282779, partial [Saccostrea cucullata]|uniref:uncharacterized protein LOC134282779 n=1 Tax=Saccostrea cuccullata TaxID=36930 RepID=UPI002ED4707E